MSVRDYSVLWLGAQKAVSGITAVGGSVLLKVPQHKLDGPEHLTADDTTHLDATTAEHGLLPKLSGSAAQALLGDGTWGAFVSTLDGLADVVITSPVVAQRLRYDGAHWVNVFTRYEPQFDSTGSAILDGVGNPIMVEVWS